MLLPPLSRREIIGLLVILALMAAVYHQGEQIERLRAVPHPKVVTVRVTEKAKETKRGPVKTTKTVVVAPDGTKTTTSTRDVAAEEIKSSSKIDDRREETPIFAPLPKARTRWVALTLDPILRAPRAARVGLTLWERLDVGVSGDWRYKAAGLEVGWRF